MLNWGRRGLRSDYIVLGGVVVVSSDRGGVKVTLLSLCSISMELMACSVSNTAALQGFIFQQLFAFSIDCTVHTLGHVIPSKVILSDFSLQ